MRGRKGLCGPEDRCACGHRRAEHSGIAGEYPGACSVCRSIQACSVFRAPLPEPPGQLGLLGLRVLK